MTYMEHIRNLSDEDFAYFLNFLQPDIELFALAMERTLQVKRSVAGTHSLNGDARSLYFTMQKDHASDCRVDQRKNLELICKLIGIYNNLPGSLHFCISKGEKTHELQRTQENLSRT